MRKLIFIKRVPYLKWEHHRFGAEYMMEKGYSVEIWAPYETYSSKYEEDGRLYQGDNLFVLKENEFEKRVKENLDAVYIFAEILFPWLEIILKKNCRYVLQYDLTCTPGFDILPHVTENNVARMLKEKVLRGLKRGLKENLRLIRKKREQTFESRQTLDMCEQLFARCPPCAVYAATKHGTVGRGTLYPEYIRKTVSEKAVYLHSTDYDRFIEANRKDPIVKEKHILFCDSGNAALFLPREKEQLSELRKHIDAYYQQLEILFKKLEEHYQVPIVIAGHPRCYYTKNDFSGREIIVNQSCELARDAAAVIVDCSTSISFPILYNKPIMLIYNSYFQMKTCDSINGGGYRSIFDVSKCYVDLVKVGFLNLDDAEMMKEPWKQCVRPDSTARENYIRNYIIDSDHTDKTIAEYMEEDLMAL